MGRLSTLAPLALALGLLALGAGALIAPGLSSAAYGVPAPELTWVRATGARDLTLGLMTLILWRRHPAALRSFLPAMLLLPLADAMLVLVAGQPAAAVLPHLLGAVGFAVLVGLTLSGLPAPAPAPPPPPSGA